MRLRIGVLITALALTFAVVRSTRAQTVYPYFTIVEIPDIHSGGGANDPTSPSWTSVRNFIERNAHTAPWNIVGGIHTGDIGLDMSDFYTSGANTPVLFSQFRHFWDIGVPFVVLPGNHDAINSSPPYQDSWNNGFGTPMKGWMTLFPNNLIFANDESYTGTTFHPVSDTQYVRVDALTTAGTVKVAITGSNMWPTATAINQIKTQALIDSDRIVIHGQHMFLAATFAAQSLPNTTDQICSFSMPNNIALCGSANLNGMIDATGVWNILKTIPNLVSIVNGHTHGESFNDGVHSLRVNNDSGNPVQMLSGHMIGAGTKAGIVMLLKFRTDNNTIEFYEWISCVNYPTCTVEAADIGVWGAPLVMPWVPIVGGGSSVLRKKVANGKFDGRVQ